MTAPFAATPTGFIRYDEFVSALFKKEALRDQMIHLGMAIPGEAGEFADAIKKHIAYGKPLDRENIKEELGDVLFFTFAAMQVFGFSFSEILDANVKKLYSRYPAGTYSNAAAVARLDKIQEDGAAEASGQQE